MQVLDDATAYLPAAHVLHSGAAAPLYLPATQSVQLPAPAGEYVPAVHGLQFDAKEEEYFPATHVLHSGAAAPLYLPASQEPQVPELSAPSVGEDLPAAQLVHACTPVFALYVPLEHATHELPDSV